MHNIQGIIACAGSGTRFAQSVDKPPPYPKHLEMIGSKSVLQRALEGLIHNISVESVTFTLNDTLKDTYIPHLEVLQQICPDIPLRYVVEKRIPGARFFTNIQTSINQGICQLDGSRMELVNPVVAITLGDCVTTSGNKNLLEQDLTTILPRVERGESFAIFRDPTLTGLLYWFSKLSELRGGKPDYSKSTQEYGLEAWNCNTIEDLHIAERGLSHSLYDREPKMTSNYNPRKEF